MSQKKKTTRTRAKSPAVVPESPVAAAKKKEPVKKQLTSTQLFAAYTRALENVRRLADKVEAETAKVDRFRAELAERFNIYVSGQPATVPSNPAPEPEYPPLMNKEGEDAGKYKPPAQLHAPAVAIPDTGAVDQIRADSGVGMREAEDSEQLQADGLGIMGALHSTLGKAATPPNPGAHESGARASVERSNAGGGPVVQKPKAEGE